MINKEFTINDLKKAFEDGRLFEARELELDTAGRDTVFEVWVETFLKEEIIYHSGDLVKINHSFLGEPANVLGYVYEEYIIGNSKGVSVITENGENLGGFSKDEQYRYFDFVKTTDFKYIYFSDIKLSNDFDKLIKPLFK